MRIAIFILCLLAGGFYLNTLYPLMPLIKQSLGGDADQPHQAAIADRKEQVALRPLPGDQMDLVRSVFASSPE